MYSVDLKLFRKQNGLNQVQAANYFSCDQSFISQIENGKSKVPDDFIAKILQDNSIRKDALIEVESKDEIESQRNKQLIEIINIQVESLKTKDEQINRLITLLENQLKK